MVTSTVWQASGYLGEEWHAVDAVLHVDWLLRKTPLRNRVTSLWQAHNTFAFDRLKGPWLKLRALRP